MLYRKIIPCVIQDLTDNIMSQLPLLFKVPKVLYIVF